MRHPNPMPALLLAAAIFAVPTILVLTREKPVDPPRLIPVATANVPSAPEPRKGKGTTVVPQVPDVPVADAFYATESLPIFIEQHATDPDGRTAFYLAEASRLCGATVRVFEATGLVSADLTRCEGFNPETAVPWQDWQQRALDARDPLALLQDAQAHPERVTDAIQAAATSGDPEAHLALGQFLLMQKADPTEGLAWILNACTHLACPVDDPRFGPGCEGTGSCLSGETLPEWLGARYGFAAMQKAEARARML